MAKGASKGSHRFGLVNHPECPVAILIHDCPSDKHIQEYISLMQEHGVQYCARLCEATYYDESPLVEANIHVEDLNFQDGTFPSKDILIRFRDMVKRAKLEFNANKTTSILDKPCISVHCVSGIGRAPVMASVVLIDHGIDNLTAVEFVRSRRRGAINSNQLKDLLKYKPKKPSSNSSSSNSLSSSSDSPSNKSVKKTKKKLPCWPF